MFKERDDTFLFFFFFARKNIIIDNVLENFAKRWNFYYTFLHDIYRDNGIIYEEKVA